MELICADFLAGASLEADPALPYLSLMRLYEFLRPQDQVRFVDELQPKQTKSSLR